MLLIAVKKWYRTVYIFYVILKKHIIKHKKVEWDVTRKGNFMSIYQKIQTSKFKVLGVYNYGYDTHQIIDIDDEKLPKKPIICRKCKSNQQHTLRPKSFLLRKGNVYVLFTCSKCKQSILKEYSQYARESLGVKNGLGHYIPPTDSGEKIIPAHKKVLDSTLHQRHLKTIKDILHLDSE